LAKYILYSASFCPFSRKVRFFFEERGIEYELEEIKFWLRNKDFLKLNQASEVPVVKNIQTKDVVCDSFLICNYLEEIEKGTGEFDYFNFYGENRRDSIEIQRLHMWFDKKFYNEVSKYFIEEIFLNTMIGNDSTNTAKIGVGNVNLDMHIRYMEFLLSKRKWLASEIFSMADIAAATQISVIDYLGYVKWDKHPKLKEWYMTVKSKKGFRNMLTEKIPGFTPSKHYSELDF
jgi:glutathione S-transferase